MESPGTPPSAIVRVKPVRVFQNDFGALYNDEIRGPAGQPGRYLRWEWAHAGVVVVPVHAGRVGLWRMYRYPIGAATLEFPRGGVEPGESVAEAALRELAEETGMVGDGAQVLGRIHPDSGLIGSACAVVSAEVIRSEAAAARNEPMESVARTVTWLDPDEFSAAVADGELTCAITIAAWALHRTHGRRAGDVP